MRHRIIIFAALCLAASGCQDEEVTSGFLTTTAIGNEGDGAQSIVIDLGETTTSAVTISFAVGGDAALDGDYKLNVIGEYGGTSTLSVTVQPGESTASLSFNLLDDTQVEPDNEVIYFQITSVSDEHIANAMKHTTFAYEIEDNDVAPSTGMQVDLAWNLGDGVRVNTANFDLYLASAVTLNSSSEVDSFTKVDQIESTNVAGFESYVIPESLSDEQYYIIIHYVSGSSNANVTLQMSQLSDQGSAAGRVGSNFVGKYMYYGPITKNGATFILR